MKRAPENWTPRLIGKANDKIRGRLPSSSRKPSRYNRETSIGDAV